MGKHTPGPWISRTDGIRTWIMGANQKFYVTEAFRLQQASAEPAATAESRIERHIADARLISAAPELLELLIEALPWVEAHLDDPVNKPGVVKKFANRIRALISRIEP